MAQMAGMIFAILMCTVLNVRIQVPKSRSKEERLSEEDAQTSLLAEVEATFSEGSARIRVKQLQQEVGPSVNTGQVAAEAEGLQLHMSAKSNSGYLGVRKQGNQFQVAYKSKYLGGFATALEAAVAYATASAAGGSAESTRIRVKQPKELQQEDGPSVNTGQADADAEGLQLHMSAKSNSSDLDVRKHGNQFQVVYKRNYLGRFATALEAAVAYAIARAAGGSAEDDGDGAADTILAPLQPHAQAPLGNVSHVVLDPGSDTDLASTSTDANDGLDGYGTDLISGSKDEDKAEGLQLHMSAKSNCGYLGVHRSRNLFKVNYKKKHLGSFATTLEAAAAYATAKAAAGSAKSARIRVKQLKGLQLHMSAKSKSGYLGVRKQGLQFQAEYKTKYIGRFATSLEAAVAYATARAAGGSKEDDGSRAADTLLAPLQPHAQAPRGNLSHVVPFDNQSDC